MTKRTKIALVALVGGAVLQGCNGSGGGGSAYQPKTQPKVTPATITKENQAELFPMKVGNTWTYTASSSQVTPGGNRSSEAEVTFRLIKVKDIPDGKEGTIEVSSDGSISDHIVWRVDSKGIAQISGELKDAATNVTKVSSFEPPSVVVPFPVTPDQFSEMDGVGPRPGAGFGPYHQTTKVWGVQEVDTDSGRLSALAAEIVSTYSQKDIKFNTTANAFWAPKVGLVRYVQEVVATNTDGRQITQTSILRLKSSQF